MILDKTKISNLLKKISIVHLILDIMKLRSTEKIDLSKLELEQVKASWNLLKQLFPIKDYADLMLKDPEAYKEKLDELKETTKRLKEIMEEYKQE